MNDIDILERVCQCRRFSGVFTDVECIFKAIENLISENKELKEENEHLIEINNKYNDMKYITRIAMLYIPKSKVEEKIKELKNKMNEDEPDEFGIHSVAWACLDYVIDELQSLLGKE